MLIPFFLGFLCGLLASVIGWRLKDHFQLTLKDDEKYLLTASRAAKGRLILRREQALTGETLLLLKEFPNPRRMEDQGQVERLLARKLLVPDPSGVPDRYLLTPKGRKRCEGLPAFPLQLVRQGSWFNSISQPLRRVRR